MKNLKDGTLIFIPGKDYPGVIGIILANNDPTWSDTYYKIYWIDDNSDVLYSVLNLESQISGNNIQVIYEP